MKISSHYQFFNRSLITTIPSFKGDLMEGNPTSFQEEQEGMGRVKRAVGGLKQCINLLEKKKSENKESKEKLRKKVKENQELKKKGCEQKKRKNKKQKERWQKNKKNSLQ